MIIEKAMIDDRVLQRFPKLSNPAYMRFSMIYNILQIIHLPTKSRSYISVAKRQRKTKINTHTSCGNGHFAFTCSQDLCRQQIEAISTCIKTTEWWWDFSKLTSVAKSFSPVTFGIRLLLEYVHLHRNSNSSLWKIETSLSITSFQ